MREQMSSPFLPFVPAVAEGDIGRVVFPATSQAGRGLLAFADRDPTNPANTRTIAGPSTYTRQPGRHSIRVGGLYAPVVMDEARPVGRRRGVDTD